MLRIGSVTPLACTGISGWLLVGCAAPLPTYPRMPDDRALLVVADRLDTVRSISASADVTLTSPDGRSIRLDGAFIATPPSKARLRAWKFGTCVFDMTVLPEGVWVFVPESGPGEQRSRDLSGISSASIAPALELLAGGYFRGAHPSPGESSPQTLVATGPALGRDTVRCDIDRATLTPRRFRFALNPAQGELLLERYSLIGTTVWPRSISFRGPDGDILIRLNAVELNTELPPAAFEPPARARPLPKMQIPSPP